jgi:hypothetical protein
MLPLKEHMMFWSVNCFKDVWLSCFDLIHAPISFHFRKEDMEGLVVMNQLELVKLVNTHGTTWSLVTKKPSTGSQALFKR